jgi:hypothetical protein
MAYVPNAVPEGNGTQGLQPLGIAGNATHLSLVPLVRGKAMNVTTAPTSVALFDQGLVQVLEAAVTGLQPNHPYVLALAQSRWQWSTPAIQDLAGWRSRRSNQTNIAGERAAPIPRDRSRDRSAARSSCSIQLSNGLKQP